MSQRPNRRQRASIEDLLNEINSHIAEEHMQEPSRRSSRGTLFVDWDGHGIPIMSYRNRPQNEDSAQQRTYEEVSRNQGRPEIHTSRYHDPNDRDSVPPLNIPQRSDHVQPLTRTTVPHHEVGSVTNRRAGTHRLQVLNSHLVPKRRPVPDRTGQQTEIPAYFPGLPKMQHQRTPPHIEHVPVHAQSPALEQHRSQPQVQLQSEIQSEIQQACGILLKYKGAGANARIQGFDPENRIQYSYDGQIIHIHRSAETGRDILLETSPQPPRSDISEYYEFRIEEWEPQKQICLRDEDRELPLLPREGTRTQKVTRFVRNLIETMGIKGFMARLKADHRKKMGVVRHPR